MESLEVIEETPFPTPTMTQKLEQNQAIVIDGDEEVDDEAEDATLQDAPFLVSSGKALGELHRRGCDLNSL